MNNPVSTYRLQFHKEVTFQNLEKLIPYLSQLGVSTIYASPVFKSTPGSTHGYDGVNPNEIDPEIGSIDQLKSISNTLKENQMSWLQDIVPNHMAFHSENPWLMDVLEKGAQSAYAKFFDIAWNSRLFHGKLMVPFLRTDLDEEIGNGKVIISCESNRLMLTYEGANYPLNPRSYSTLFESDIVKQNQALAQIGMQCKEIDDVEEPAVFAERWNELLLQLSSLMKNPNEQELVDELLQETNNNPERIRRIIDQQTYVLCNWQDTDQQINFRRFFTVNGLICLNIQDEHVFSNYHALVKQLVDEGIFQGLRIDHIDGLYDPSGYLDDIRQLSGVETYVVVEKILEQHEEMPQQWPIQGTTGYEFLATVNNLFTNNKSEQAFTAFYQNLTGENEPIQKQLLQKKAHVLFEHMGGELENLYQLLVELNLIDEQDLDRVRKEQVRKAIGEFLIHCPVYRYYGNQMPLEEKEIASVQMIFDEVKKAHPDLGDAVGLLENALLVKPLEADEDFNNNALEFYHRAMQFTGPLMAKGVEDTLMYTYERFIGHNDVGDSVASFGITPKDFHKKMIKRHKNWPLSLNTTSTHDTKRGEDVRANLNVLTDIPEVWIARVKRWQEINAPIREKLAAPDVNDEYLIYQTLIGAYPMPGQDDDDFAARLEQYLQKALREAKRNTTWAEPNEEYEKGTQQFAGELLNQQGDFWKDFILFQKEISDFGIINSLSQLILKFTCPGIPDVYQGTELWDLSLVDPDNRREVDYEKRQNWLNEFDKTDRDALLEKLWNDRNDAQIKLWLTQQLFNLRKQNPDLFSEGEYVPLQVKGSLKDNVFAFARIYKKEVLIVVVPLHLATVTKQVDLYKIDWKNTNIELPVRLTPKWENLLTGENQEFERKISLAGLFKNLPFVILKGKRTENERSAGILIHISSLASPFGIGDLGPEAFAFADFLSRSNQRIWQLLPLNPTEVAQGNSPYSALSSRAGNPSLISPELLAHEGLLIGVNLAEYHLPQNGKVDFEKVEKNKSELLEKAFETFKNNPELFPEKEFDEFCKQNAEWLVDFALYMVIKEKHDGKTWTEWEEPLKLRDAKALKTLVEVESERIRFFTWVQFIFDKQWKSLRTYCNKRDIRFIGDMPFYVSYNSSDVWSHRDLFLLDENGKISGVAGVPPDAFSEDGQLWDMPVFNWEAHKEHGYAWWINRLQKNIELYDLTRMDHFRAFADYWVVSGDEKTAVKGEWKLGPGSEFLKTLDAALGGLPFVAEDLGEISPVVLELRDEFNLPGMKVLQFAFDECMAESEFAPHNYTTNFVAYTGTHDNNTIKGWFQTEADKEARERLEAYVGCNVNEDNVNGVMIRLAYSSVAKMAVVPIQDVLGLDEFCKMNSPGSGKDNWTWCLLPGQLTSEAEKQLKLWTRLYNRI
ncbi:malto-oligosyltrehalose synthase [Dyadobacter sp. CY312]|uniref:malto-oligosyltrehalose synthase n=1 Tax=Dyadobacter sp. CY312 TaxID=2907303 RepID=UPI001F1BA462|nr:malto-oligosyltrehalose synthase [Dyadobacter sp. CY312]MCE7042887.1 malto-oligosyltrehalose synthase [Dyadobacter sp. CY312]